MWRCASRSSEIRAWSRAVSQWCATRYALAQFIWRGTPKTLQELSKHAYLGSAIAGQGIIMWLAFDMADAICRGDLVPILRSTQWLELNAYAVYLPTSHISTGVRAFVD